jgi:hypothetical protein
MLNKKQRFFRLIESYINDFRGDAVREFYGNNARIKIHTMTHSFSTNTLLFEIVIVLGETINESVMDDTLASVLVQDSMVYFHPESKIQTYVRFDT